MADLQGLIDKVDKIVKKSAFNKYNKAFNVYSGSEGMGEWALLPSGDIRPINTVKDGRVLDYSQLPPNTEIIQVGYKGDKFERKVLKINAQGIPEKTNFSNKTRGQLNSLFSEIGINIEYPNIKL